MATTRLAKIENTEEQFLDFANYENFFFFYNDLYKFYKLKYKAFEKKYPEEHNVKLIIYLKKSNPYNYYYTLIPQTNKTDEEVLKEFQLKNNNDITTFLIAKNDREFIEKYLTFEYEKSEFDNYKTSEKLKEEEKKRKRKEERLEQLKKLNNETFNITLTVKCDNREQAAKTIKTRLEYAFETDKMVDFKIN